MTEKPDALAIALELLKAPTERDQQTKVGASNFSASCVRCLADALMKHNQTSEPEDRFAWAGAVIGTAIHDYLEKRVRYFHPDWLPEQKVALGELPEYGVIKSTTDLYIPEQKHVIDWKSTTKAKLVFIKRAFKDEPSEYDLTDVTDARYKVASYVNQVMSYGRGMVLAGHDVEWVSLVFVCRDAVGDKDIWSKTLPYDAEQAEKVWDRLVRLWDWLTAGGEPDTLPSSAGCYFCSHYR